jgi:hypothetical protein
MATYSQQIALFGSSLQLGETIREICPRCDGGSSREKSLTITLGENGLVWNCFRAKCDESGSNGSGNHTPSESKPLVKKVRRFEGTTKALRDTDKSRIKALWGISDPLYWYFTPDLGGRIAMSIRSPTYAHRGWVMRDIKGTSQCKAITYVNEGQEGLSWYREHLSSPTIIVEDIPSAVRAAVYCNSVALNGTACGSSRAVEIAEYATRPIIVALDQDATAEAFKIAEKWALLWGDVKVLPLVQDIKNMGEEDVKRLLSGL